MEIWMYGALYFLYAEMKLQPFTVFLVVSHSKLC